MSSNVPNNNNKNNVVEKPHKLEKTYKLSFKELYQFSEEFILEGIKKSIPPKLWNCCMDNIVFAPLYTDVYKETKKEFKSKNLYFEYDPISLSNEGLFNPELNKYINENDEKKHLMKN